MAITKTSTSGLTNGGKTTHLLDEDEGWVRPADWLALPAVSGQKMVGLVAIYPGDSNWVHISANNAYTVDWGDGTAPQNVANATVANHNYTYASVSGTDCTRGYRQAIITITPQSGLNLTNISLANATRPTGMVSGWSSAWLDIKMIGTSIAALTISTAATRAAMLERFEFVGNSNITSTVPNFSNARSLQEIVGTAWTSGVTTFGSMFLGCTSLQTIPLLDTGAGLSFNAMFSGCSALEEVPLLNTAAGLDFISMFSGCFALRTIPLLVTSAGTAFPSMFNVCTALQTVPLLATGAGLNFNAMFTGCSSLQSVPALNVAAGTDFTNMFASCSSLQSAPLAGTSRSISYVSAKLKGTELDAIYTGLATVNTNLLSANAASVETSAADWNVSPVNCTVSTSNTFPTSEGANVLRQIAIAAGEVVSAITTRIAVSASTTYTFLATCGTPSVSAQACRLRIGWYDAGGSLISTSNGAENTTGANGILKQQSMTVSSPVGAVTASLILSWTSVAASVAVGWDRMGLFLGTVSLWTPPGAPTITVTSNWDVASDTPSIATNKGWTVTG